MPIAHIARGLPSRAFKRYNRPTQNNCKVSTVIPAQAGTQSLCPWIPACAGKTKGTLQLSCKADPKHLH